MGVSRDPHVHFGLFSGNVVQFFATDWAGDGREGVLVSFAIAETFEKSSAPTDHPSPWCECASYQGTHLCVP